MGICALCNGYEEFHLVCEKCGEQSRDHGRIMDFYDDYSAYMEIDLLKMEDGFPDTRAGNKCPHLFRCTGCYEEKIYLIKE